MSTIWVIAIISTVGIMIGWYLLLGRQNQDSGRGSVPPILSEVTTSLSLEHVFNAVLSFAKETTYSVTHIDEACSGMILSSSSSRFEHGFRFPLRFIATAGGTKIEIGISSFGITQGGHEWYEQHANRRMMLSLSRCIGA